MESVTSFSIINSRNAKVLNAFRHHGIGHQQKSVIYTDPSGCSTPSGIMESVTMGVRPVASARTSAQRLPASWNRSLRPLERFGVETGCSTPSGIMESVTPAKRHHLLMLRVLNAFRHHGIGHDRTASMLKAESWCSTPSGIMESVTERRGLRRRVEEVLNAFRHHGIGHPNFS